MLSFNSFYRNLSTNSPGGFKRSPHSTSISRNKDAESRLKLEKKLKNQIIAKLTASTSKSASKYNHSPSINLILYFLNFYKDWK